MNSAEKIPQESSENNLWAPASPCVSSLAFCIFIDTKRCLKVDLKGTCKVLRSVCLCYKVTSLFPMFKHHLGKLCVLRETSSSFFLVLRIVHSACPFTGICEVAHPDALDVSGLYGPMVSHAGITG